MVEDKITTCIECGNLIEICYCFCPYCGEGNEYCKCTEKEHVFEEQKISLESGNQIFVSLKSPISQNNLDDSLDNYTRLEKWHIGRANFP